ncbi:DEAD/DEAH box helicase [Metabacillus endolithicus]|uniref:DEAD/DEAH box helicase n=1 Tax=Metabacillus endolithicus TaxID=1535204 RepID=A0ABW5C5V8_9BACI|nr:DEAD/DEAH box helicase [Metabacillus endolithicus]UPG62121.1 DEAD/DEAH box helicase [Metabacillus endolithicus]
MTLENFLQELEPFIQSNWSKAEFENPTAIQLKAVPQILEGNDVIAESPTGTGKTLAYVLPLLNKIDVNRKAAQVVILAPSRELVMQIFDEVKKWSEGSGMTSASFIGGANIKRQVDKLKKSPQIILGTPGRIYELIKMKKLKMHEVKAIVLDEGDQLLIPENKKTIQDIVKTTLNERQVVLFSATLNESTESKARDLMKKDPEIIKVGKEEVPTGKVDHVYLVCEQRDKALILEKLVKNIPMKALGFVKDIGNLSVLGEKLDYKGVDVHLLHSDTKKEEREAALKSLRTEKQGLLLATDVAARGLDIAELTHVIHYDLPSTSSQYVHRSGRTGRQGASGTVVSIVTEREERELKKLAKELNITVRKNELFRGELAEV